MTILAENIQSKHMNRPPLNEKGKLVNAFSMDIISELIGP